MKKISEVIAPIDQGDGNDPDSYAFSNDRFTAGTAYSTHINTEPYQGNPNWRVIKGMATGRQFYARTFWTLCEDLKSLQGLIHDKQKVESSPVKMLYFSKSANTNTIYTYNIIDVILETDFKNLKLNKKSKKSEEEGVFKIPGETTSTTQAKATTPTQKISKDASATSADAVAAAVGDLSKYAKDAKILYIRLYAKYSKTGKCLTVKEFMDRIQKRIDELAELDIILPDNLLYPDVSSAPEYKDVKFNGDVDSTIDFYAGDEKEQRKLRATYILKHSPIRLCDESGSDSGGQLYFSLVNGGFLYYARNFNGMTQAVPAAKAILEHCTRDPSQMLREAAAGKPENGGSMPKANEVGAAAALATSQLKEDHKELKDGDVKVPEAPTTNQSTSQEDKISELNNEIDSADADAVASMFANQRVKH